MSHIPSPKDAPPTAPSVPDEPAGAQDPSASAPAPQAGGQDGVAAAVPPSPWRSIADKIVTQCLAIAPGEVVQLGGGVHNFDFVGALAAAVRRVGAYPELNITSDDMQLEMLLTVPEKYLRTVPPHRLRWLEEVDALIVTDAIADPRRADAVPQARRAAAHAAAEAVERRLFELGPRWLYVGYPTPNNASDLPVPVEELQPLFWEAVDVDYEALAAEGAALAAALEKGGRVRVTTARGTDLSFDIGQRPVLVDDGVVKPADAEEGDGAVHLPAGRVLVAPVETSAAGRIVVDWAWQGGHFFAGLVLDVEKGRLRPNAAGKGAEPFQRLQDDAQGDKDRLGVFAIGLNPAVTRFTGYPALDEKRRGAVHMTLGDNRLFGGDNVSTFHFDLFLDAVTVAVDGAVVVEDGKVLV